MTPGSQGRISARPLAWLVLPLAVIVAVLILFFGRGNVDQDLPPVVSGGEQGLDEVVLRGPTGNGDSTNYRPITSAKRETALQRLAEFRARYRQSQPFIVVTSAASPQSLSSLAREIGSALSTHGLGTYQEEKPDSHNAPGLPTQPVMRLAPRDSRIARELLWALEPYLAGHITLVYQADLRTDQIQLYMRGNPRFSGEGEAHFATR